MIDAAPETATHAAPTGPASGAGLPSLPNEAVAVLAEALAGAARRLADDAAARAVRPGFVGAREAAAFCGVGLKAFRAMVRRRLVPCIRVNGKTQLFQLGAIAEALQRLESPARRAR